MANDVTAAPEAMANDVTAAPEASMTQLVGGIITDVQDLIKQQLALLRHELGEDVRKSKDVGILFGWGLGIALVGGVLFGLMLAGALSWAVPGLPLWVCYGLAGAPIAALGGALFYAGLHKLKSFNMLPGESALAFKENVQWITKPN